MTLWLLRHAAVLAVAQARFGQTDLQADPIGTLAAARAIVDVLPAELVVRCSPLTRCQDLARAIAALRPGMVVDTDARLAEMGMGAWEGRRWSDIPAADMDAWTARFADHRLGEVSAEVAAEVAAGLPASESVREFMQRVGAAWDDWRADPVDTLWVAHAGVARAVELIERGVRYPESAAQWPRDGLGFGQWSTVQVDV